MADEGGLKITIRLSNEELEAIEEFMAANDVYNRSDLIREAIGEYLSNHDRHEPESSNEGIFVHLSPLHLNAIKRAVELGAAYSEEELIRTLVLKSFIPQDDQERLFAKAMNDAKGFGRNE